MAFRVTPVENVGRYCVLGELGQGGTATVCLAAARGPSGFNRLVVLKKMRPEFQSEPGFADMFASEARLATQLQHPNIVQTHELIEHDGLPVLVMEYLEGKSLADIIAARTPDSSFGLWHWLTVISEVLSGLHYSHELVDSRGLPLELVHRDVTPHNVFVTYDGRVKVLDFGIAKVRNSSVRTETGIVKGKLRYIPPEQFLGEVVDRRADIYSVGVMLWETAAGEKLWRGLSDAVVMNRVINEQIPRPSVRNPDACPLLEAVLMKALNPDPNQRHQTALQLKQELDEVRQALAAAVSPRSLLWAMDAAHGAERRTTRARVDAQLEELKRGETPASGGTLKTFAAAKPPRTRSFGAWWTLVPVVGAIGAWVWLLERLGTSEHTLQPAELPSATVEGLLASPEVPAQPVASHTLAPAALRSAGSSETAASGAATAAPLAERSPTPARSEAPPQAKAAQPRVDATAAPTAPGEPSSPRKAAKPAACEPPFVLDERGLKRFKPECLR